MKKILLLSLLLIATMFLFAEPEVEPNNSWDADGVITVGNGVNEGVIDPGDDLDYWAFQASVADEIVVSTMGLSIIDTKLWIYDIDGVSELAYNDDNGGTPQSEVSITVNIAGTYYFAVGTYSSATGDYGVSLTGANTPASLDNDLIAMGISGNPTPTMGIEQTCNVAIMNVGNNDATDFSVEVFNGYDVSMGITDGNSLAAGENMVVDVNWTPDTEGIGVIYALVNFAADEDTSNNQTDDMNVDVQSPGTIAITLGDGTDDGHYLPCNYYYKNSLAEQLYYAEELQISGALMAIDFFYTFADVPTVSDLNIWVGETTLTDLSTGFIPSTELTQIHSGPLEYSVGEGTIHIPFATPYAYGGGNLVVLVERPMDTVYYSSSDNFYYTIDEAHPDRSIYKYSDTVDYDPANPPADGTTTNTFPNTAFYFSSEVYNAPTNLEVTEVTDDTATVMWEEPGAALAGSSNIHNREVIGYNLYLGTAVVAEGITELTYEFTNLDIGTDYVVGVTAVYTGDVESEMITVELTTTSIDYETPVLTTALNSNYPNPFNPVTTISYDLAVAGDVNISVYNVKGQLVKTLVNEFQDSAQRSVVWSGLDNNNRSVASGVYFYKMNTTGFTSINKMILMK